MNAPSTEKTSLLEYPYSTIKRSQRALSCSPFQLKLLAQMRSQSVPLPLIAGQSGIEQGYTRQPLSEQRVESDLLWLISVGLLRREVDGQGITDSFRLTPLGKQLLDKWESLGETFPSPTAWDILLNALNRWLRLPL